MHCCAPLKHGVVCTLMPYVVIVFRGLCGITCCDLGFYLSVARMHFHCLFESLATMIDIHISVLHIVLNAIN